MLFFCWFACSPTLTPFCVAELQSAASALGETIELLHRPPWLHADSTLSLFCVFEAASVDVVRGVAARCMLVRAIYQLIAAAATMEGLLLVCESHCRNVSITAFEHTSDQLNIHKNCVHGVCGAADAADGRAGGSKVAHGSGGAKCDNNPASNMSGNDGSDSATAFADKTVLSCYSTRAGCNGVGECSRCVYNRDSLVGPPLLKQLYQVSQVSIPHKVKEGEEMGRRGSDTNINASDTKGHGADKRDAVSVRVETVGRHYSAEEKDALAIRLADAIGISLSATCGCKKQKSEKDEEVRESGLPCEDIFLILEHAVENAPPGAKAGWSPSGPVQRVLCGTFVVGSSRQGLLTRYSLQCRPYIGTTSMPPEPAFVMAHLACVRRGSFVFDPFAGTCGVLVAAAHYGAVTFAGDVDGRAMQRGTQRGLRSAQQRQQRAAAVRALGEEALQRAGVPLEEALEGPTVRTNFKIYGLNPPERVRMNFALWEKTLRLRGWGRGGSLKNVAANFEGFGSTANGPCISNVTNDVSRDGSNDASNNVSDGLGMAAVSEARLCEGFLDAIVTDPPYGIREPRKSAAPKQTNTVAMSTGDNEGRGRVAVASHNDEGNKGSGGNAHRLREISEDGSGQQSMGKVLNETPISLNTELPVKNTSNARDTCGEGRDDEGCENQMNDDARSAKTTAVETPSTSYAVSDIVLDLMLFAAEALVMGGRLVLWYPSSSVHYCSEELPSHPSLQLLYNIPQRVSLKIVRRLLVFVKTHPPPAVRPVREMCMGSSGVPDLRELMDQTELPDNEAYMHYREKLMRKRVASQRFHSAQLDMGITGGNKCDVRKDENKEDGGGEICSSVPGVLEVAGGALASPSLVQSSPSLYFPETSAAVCTSETRGNRMTKRERRELIVLNRERKLLKQHLEKQQQHNQHQPAPQNEKE
ncbi:methyltransferase, putative [Trypanosoma brucei gambiense DAL972]|uniref:Methyltransferase, putative n=1 Tax=Trypanosoma brucei gambiense (strain MHOM/CI/86/DAL972) TaxID=679716 RepID=C9ZND4_TRYB9|nr:methyltransferase, putative [Trypanosoma brucei gambiense DAL972]CBH10912.1 methyltransferase, putative [Trypanosoma brucei gambiense DAL972]|eukprot:XP_011773199.1 methyltransferase, putative [Trypanosoma brucei gambiense DAL972]